VTDPALPAFARGRLFPWVASAPFVLWPLLLLARGELRPEHVAFMVGVPALAFTRRRLFTGLLPAGLVAVLYDVMRYAKNVGLSADRVLLCDLRRAELALFGVTLDGGTPGTLHDLIQSRPPNLFLDALCAVPYATYLLTIVAAAVFLYRHDFARLQRFTWTFFLLNVAGFAAHHAFPAAPPWYFHAHGCLVDVAARPSAGANLLRVDALLGFDYFRGFYGRSSETFGALPSLHVAYPALLAVECWPYLEAPGRAAALGYAALMCFAAVYLDHHWVLDVLLGLAFAAALHAVARRALRPPTQAPTP
jgi:membrane-associated phospholipid phosphatase